MQPKYVFSIFTKFFTHFWSLITILPFNSPDCRGNWISDTFLAWPKFNKMHEKMKKITNMAFIFWRLLKVDKRQVSLNRFKGQKLPKSQFHAVLPALILWEFQIILKHNEEISVFSTTYILHEINFRHCRGLKNCHFDNFRCSEFRF